MPLCSLWRLICKKESGENLKSFFQQQIFNQPKAAERLSLQYIILPKKFSFCATLPFCKIQKANQNCDT